MHHGKDIISDLNYVNQIKKCVRHTFALHPLYEYVHE